MILLLKTLLLVSQLNSPMDLENARQNILQADFKIAFQSAPLLGHLDNHRVLTKVYDLNKDKGADGARLMLFFNFNDPAEIKYPVQRYNSNPPANLSISFLAIPPKEERNEEENFDYLNPKEITRENTESKIIITQDLLEKVLSIKEKGDSQEALDDLISLVRSGLAAPGKVFLDNFVKTESYKTAVEDPAFHEALKAQEKERADARAIETEKDKKREEILAAAINRLKTDNLISSIKPYRGVWRSEDKKFAIIFDFFGSGDEQPILSKLLYIPAAYAKNSDSLNEFLHTGLSSPGQEALYPVLGTTRDLLRFDDEADLENRIYEKIKSIIEKAQKDIAQL